MKKAIVVLIMIVGIFTSCEKEELVIDCGCIKTTYNNHSIDEDGVPFQKEISKENVECQEEGMEQDFKWTTFVECIKIKN